MKRLHLWKPCGWDERGRSPIVHEMECEYCGLILDIDSGEKAESKYCMEELA
jgi:hypothetical protein